MSSSKHPPERPWGGSRQLALSLHVQNWRLRLGR